MQKEPHSPTRLSPRSLKLHRSVVGPEGAPPILVLHGITGVMTQAGANIRGIDIVGTPGKIDSNITISPSGSGCTYDIEFEVSAKVPLIRKKLEEFVAKTTAEGMRDEHEYNKRQLDAAG